jgi:tellurite resistance protein
VGSKIGCGDSAAHIIAMHGRDAAKHVLDLAWAVIAADPEPDPDEISRLARLMREIEANQRQQIHRIAERYSA